MKPITKPIILVGTGRCGSTVFHRLLATHPRLMWLSGFAYQFPSRPEGAVHARESLGLLGMQERAQQFGGELRIDGVSGEGTTVTLHLPLSPLHD
jgi:hypothetical protein